MTSLRVPRDRLPTELSARHSALRTYFCDKDAVVRETAEHWCLDLSWSDGTERYVDPQLSEGLAWWGEGVGLGTMASARKRSGKVLSALYDTWTLHSWSEWLARRNLDASAKICILHVDDHRDLMAPRLFLKGSGWHDPIAARSCELAKPDSVAAAIESGAIGMGSFLTPFLHRFPRADVRHLCQPPKCPVTSDYQIGTISVPDDLLDPAQLRPAVTLADAPGKTGPGYYRQTPDVADWLAGLQAVPMLLHIDMDYFNNRFDGDSDWASNDARLDPSLDNIFARIDDMTTALIGSGVAANIEDVVIAYSPGFFPAEYWAPAEARLRTGLDQFYA